MGFIPGIKEWVNRQKLIIMIYHHRIKGKKNKTKIISVDAVKDFDKIPHPFTIKTLNARNRRMLTMIKAIYKKPITNSKHIQW